MLSVCVYGLLYSKSTFSCVVVSLNDFIVWFCFIKGSTKFYVFYILMQCVFQFILIESVLFIHLFIYVVSIVIIIIYAFFSSFIYF